jgi:hypothetical protein
MLRIIVGTSVVMSSGCAYFHPAFITNASQLSASKSAQEGVLVCERHSLRRSACTVMPRSDLQQVLNERPLLDTVR